MAGKFGSKRIFPLGLDGKPLYNSLYHYSHELGTTPPPPAQNYWVTEAGENWVTDSGEEWLVVE